MKKVFQARNNDNFYHLKELQWSNKAMKLNQLNAQIINPNNNIQNKNSINYLKENSWNKRFIYNKIQDYDSAKDKNFIASKSKNDEMNCYYNALKKNDRIMKNIYTSSKGKKKGSVEFSKTNIKFHINPYRKVERKAKINSNSFSNNNFNFKNNRILSSNYFQYRKDFKKFDEFEKFLNSTHNSPDKLSKIWNDLCILEPYRELFSILITQLSEKNKEDFCEREFNELYELRSDLQLLSTSVYYRNKILENLNILNDKLGVILKSKQLVSNEVLFQKISKKIENLREHTVNICFLMQKIKSKINQGHPWGKYNLDLIAEKYKFDKNYLIKMKEEMCVLKDGYTKYFFDIGEESNPFLLSASNPEDLKNKVSDPFFHYVPLSEEMRENINQCIYIIYQELIGYQNSNVSENNFRNISPLKKYKYTDIEIKIYKKHNESLNNSMNNSLYSLSTNNIWVRKSAVVSPARNNYSGIHKSNNVMGDKNSNTINNIPNKKRILSGYDNNNNNLNKFFSKNDKISNDTGDKTTNYKNNNDIKDLVNDNNINNIEIDINSRENNIDKEKINNDKKENEKNKDININNISNIKEEKNNIINTKSEKEELDFNDEINNKDKFNKNLYLKNPEENNKLDEIIEEEKMKTDTFRNKSNNKKEEINFINKNEELIKSNEKKDEDENSENTENLERELRDEPKELNNNKINDNNKDNLENNNKSNISKKIKNLKINIFSGDISLFSKDIYIFYYSLIPQIIKEMFKIESVIFPNILKGISPYMLLIYEKTLNQEEDLNWINLKNNLKGLCVFSFEYKNGTIKLIINHLSTSNIIKEENNIKAELDTDSLEQLKYIFNTAIEYIKKNFYFDEIILIYDSEKTNENILNIFLNDLNFVIINETDREEIKVEENNKKIKINNNNKEHYGKIVYTNDLMKNRVNEYIRRSIQQYIGKNIIDIFDSVLITSNAEFIGYDKNKKNEGNLINNILLKHLLDKKDKLNVNKIYNKIQNLDQLIKLFQNHNINNKELPLSLAENRFDILCTVLNKALFNNYFSNSALFNNFSNNNSISYLDETTNIYYNFIKAEKILILENEKYNIKFCHLLNNNLSIFFCKTNIEFLKYLSKGNIYTQINNVYKNTLSMHKNKVFVNKIIWIPCFEIYKHFKTLSNNSSGTIHEYIKISNKNLIKPNKELLRINGNDENCFIKIEPELNKDFVLDNDFIFGIINNAEILKEKFLDKNKKDEYGGNEDDNIDEEIEGEDFNKDEPYIIFLSHVKKSDFIINNIFK